MNKVSSSVGWCRFVSCGDFDLLVSLVHPVWKWFQCNNYVVLGVFTYITLLLLVFVTLLMHLYYKNKTFMLKIYGCWCMFTPDFIDSLLPLGKSIDSPFYSHLAHLTYYLLCMTLRWICFSDVRAVFIFPQILELSVSYLSNWFLMSLYLGCA